MLLLLAWWEWASVARWCQALFAAWLYASTRVPAALFGNAGKMSVFLPVLSAGLHLDVHNTWWGVLYRGCVFADTFVPLPLMVVCFTAVVALRVGVLTWRFVWRFIPSLSW